MIVSSLKLCSRCRESSKDNWPLFAITSLCFPLPLSLSPPLPLSSLSLRWHSLERWVFCDVRQVAEGPRRWQRYFSARRKVEARQEQGRPGRDYKVMAVGQVVHVCVCVCGQ